MDGERVKGRGRPRKDDGLVHNVKVRISYDEMKEIEHFSKRFGCTYSDILRQALEEFVSSRRLKI